MRFGGTEKKAKNTKHEKANKQSKTKKKSERFTFLRQVVKIWKSIRDVRGFCFVVMCLVLGGMALSHEADFVLVHSALGSVSSPN